MNHRFTLRRPGPRPLRLLRFPRPPAVRFSRHKRDQRHCLAACARSWSASSARGSAWSSWSGRRVSPPGTCGPRRRGGRCSCRCCRSRSGSPSALCTRRASCAGSCSSSHPARRRGAWGKWPGDGSDAGRAPTSSPTSAVSSLSVLGPMVQVMDLQDLPEDSHLPVAEVARLYQALHDPARRACEAAGAEAASREAVQTQLARLPKRLRERVCGALGAGGAAHLG